MTPTLLRRRSTPGARQPGPAARRTLTLLLTASAAAVAAGLLFAPAAWAQTSTPAPAAPAAVPSDGGQPLPAPDPRPPLPPAPPDTGDPLPAPDPRPPLLPAPPGGPPPVPTPAPTPVSPDLNTVLANLRNWLIGISAAAATLFFTLGGLRYLGANGDPAELESAKRAFRNAAVGYGLAILAPLFLTALKSVVGA
jgi:hypothetical protein